MFSDTNFDELVRSQKKHFSVIPAKAGIQDFQGLLDPGDPVPAKAGSRGDGLEGFLRDHQLCRKYPFGSKQLGPCTDQPFPIG